MPNWSHGRNRPHPIPAHRAFGASQPGASDDPMGVRSSKDGNQVPGGGLSRLRRTSTLPSTRQDAQMNYLSTLSIFMKQTTYLATLPNPKI